MITLTELSLLWQIIRSVLTTFLWFHYYVNKNTLGGS